MWDLGVICYRKQNLKMESNGTSYSCKSKEQCSEMYFASLKEWPEVFVVGKEGQLCDAYRKGPFDPFNATGEIQWFKAAPERYKTMSKKRKYQVKATQLRQDICHLNMKQWHCQQMQNTTCRHLLFVAIPLYSYRPSSKANNNNNNTACQAKSDSHGRYSINNFSNSFW